MRHHVAVAILMSGSLLASAALAADGTSLKIATEGAYPPWNATDASGALVGFELDLAAELCERMGAECEIVAQDWDGIIPALTAGKYDAIMAGMSITEEREEVISFSSCYANEVAKFAVSKNSDFAGLTSELENINLDEVSAEEEAAVAAVKESLSGTTIGVQTATTHANFLDEYFADVVEIRNYDTQENLDLDLQSGRLDAALAAMSYWQPVLDSADGENLVAVGPGMNGGPFGRGVGVGLRQEDEELRAKFDEAIAAATADGTIDKMVVEWFGFSMPCS